MTQENPLENEVDAVLMLHGLYLIASNLREEGVGDLLEKYFRPNESSWFAYLHDAKVNIYPTKINQNRKFLFIGLL